MIVTLVTAAAIVVLQLVTPYWWWTMLVPFAVALAHPMTGWGAFRMGALSAGLIWLLGAGFLLLTTSQIIAARVTIMMNLGDEWVLLPITTLVAVVAGGVSAAAGQSLRVLFHT